MEGATNGTAPLPPVRIKGRPGRKPGGKNRTSSVRRVANAPAPFYGVEQVGQASPEERMAWGPNAPWHVVGESMRLTLQLAIQNHAMFTDNLVQQMMSQIPRMFPSATCWPVLTDEQQQHAIATASATAINQSTVPDVVAPFASPPTHRYGGSAAGSDEDDEDRQRGTASGYLSY